MNVVVTDLSELTLKIMKQEMFNLRSNSLRNACSPYGMVVETHRAVSLLWWLN